MKTKLLRKVRKQYSIFYREKPYDRLWFSITPEMSEEEINYYKGKFYLHYKLEFKYPYKNEYLYSFHNSEESCKDEIIDDLRRKYPKLGYFNRKRIENNKETLFF